MLTPEYLEACADSVLGIYDELNIKIVEDIARRIAKAGTVTDSAKWQIKQVQEAGKLMDEITHEVASITGFSDAYVKELFNDAGVASLEYESKFVTEAGLTPVTLNTSPAMMQTLAAAIRENTRKPEQPNRNNSCCITEFVPGIYQHGIHAGNFRGFSVSGSHKTGSQSGGNRGKQGLLFQRSQLKTDVAIRRSLLTGVNQTAGQLTEMYADDMACDYYETSAHVGARNTGAGYLNHESWQGQVFCISGKDHRYRQFEEATGYGTGGGLCGWNCRHSFHMFFPGLSKPAYSEATLSGYSNRKHTYKTPSGEKQILDEYECTQKQRAYERSVRESKTILAGYDAAIKAAPNATLENSMKEEFAAESVKLKKIEAEMKDFCKQTGRPVDSARTQVYAVKDDSGRIVNFGRSVSQKAVWANKKSR